MPICFLKSPVSKLDFFFDQNGRNKNILINFYLPDNKTESLKNFDKKTIQFY